MIAVSGDMLATEQVSPFSAVPTMVVKMQRHSNLVSSISACRHHFHGGDVPAGDCQDAHGRQQQAVQEHGALHVQHCQAGGLRSLVQSNFIPPPLPPTLALRPPLPAQIPTPSDRLPDVVTDEGLGLRTRYCCTSFVGPVWQTMLYVNPSHEADTVSEDFVGQNTSTLSVLIFAQRSYL